MKLTHKIFIWITSLCLVFSTLFLDIHINTEQIFTQEKIIGEYKIYQSIRPVVNKPIFKLIDVVEIDVSDLVLQPEANTLFDVIRDIAVSIFLSLGATFASNTIITTSEQFVDWYVDKWENIAEFDQMSYPGSPLYILNYLTNTGQTTTTTNNTYVVPVQSLKAIADDGQWFIDHVIQNETSYLKFATVNYINAFGQSKSTTVPKLNNQSIYTSKQFTIGTSSGNIIGKYLVYTYPSLGADYFIINSDVLPSVQKVSLGNGLYRLKLIMRLRSNELVHTYTKWTQNLTIEQIEMLDTAEYFEIIYNSNFRLLPFFDNKDMNYNFSYMYRFTYDDATDTSSSNYELPNAYRDYVIALDSTNTYSETGSINVVEDGFPIGVPIDDRNGNYYEIPLPDYNTPTPTVPTPVVDEDPWVYVPPDYTINPLPTDGTWNDVDNPVSTIPLPGVDDLLDGTFMKDLWAWFTNWLTYVVNGIMNFWEAFVNNLFTGINNVTAPVQAILNTIDTMKTNWDTVWALITGKEATYNGETFNFNELYCEILPGQKLNWFEQIIFGLVCQSSNTANAISGFFEYIINIIIYITGTLVTSITAFVSSIVALLDILPNGIKQLFVFITSSLSILLTVKFVRYILDLIGALPIL